MTDTTQATDAQDTTAATQAQAGQSAASATEPTTTLGQEGQPPAQDAKPAEGEEGKGSDADGKDDAKGAPEEYADFTLAEGMELDAEVLTEFKGIAKELGISQENAQKLIDLQASIESKRADAIEQALTEQSQQWASDLKADKEFGGEHYDKNVATAVKAIEAFGSPELRTLLNDSGIGNHPELVKFCHRIGKAISEDGLVLGGSQGTTETDPAKRLFPNMN